MELLRFTIAAGETKVFVKAGRYIEVFEAADALSIGFYDRNGGQADDALNIQSGVFIETDFAQFEVSSATAQTITLLVTDGRGGSRRQPGVVSIVDGGKARTIAGQAFIGYGSGTGGAGFVPVIQLRNAAGSGVRNVIKAIRVSASAAGNIALGTHAAALPQGPFVTANKNFGGAVSVAQLFRDTTTAAGPGTTVENLAVGANSVVSITLQEPIVLAPGTGIVVWHSVPASTLLAAFEFVEEPLV